MWWIERDRCVDWPSPEACLPRKRQVEKMRKLIRGVTSISWRIKRRKDSKRRIILAPVPVTIMLVLPSSSHTLFTTRPRIESKKRLTLSIEIEDHLEQVVILETHLEMFRHYHLNTNTRPDLKHLKEDLKLHLPPTIPISARFSKSTATIAFKNLWELKITRVAL